MFPIPDSYPTWVCPECETPLLNQRNIVDLKRLLKPKFMEFQRRLWQTFKVRFEMTHPTQTLMDAAEMFDTTPETIALWAMGVVECDLDTIQQVVRLLARM